jgi:hypothetical protein
MNARTISPATTPTPAPRFDRKFIEDHKLVERYLENKLPFKGARDLENWCRANPEYLDELKMSERASSSLKLLEAAGAAPDLGEKKAPWWKSVNVLIGLGAITLISFFAFWLLFGKYELLKMQLEDTKTTLAQGSLVQPAVETTVRVSPDHSPGIDHARIVVNHNAPQLMEVHLDLAYTQKLNQFRIIVDKKDQGRALILNYLLKDSNGELLMTLNSTGLSVGVYTVRIEALPFKGTPMPIGWLLLEVK